MGKAITGFNKPNTNTNFLPINDAANPSWTQKTFPFKDSTSMEEGAAIGIEIVTNDVTGNVTLMAVENAAGADFVGILAEPIVSTDDDYATAGKLKSVKVPTTPEAEAEFTVINGTFTTADVFKTVQIASNSIGLDVDTAGKGARITGYVSATRGRCTFSLPKTETA